MLAHSDVAPLRKEDPGELFPWRQLHEAGVGHWVPPAAIAPGPFLQAGDHGAGVGALKQRFRQYGYGIGEDSQFDAGTEAVVTAFQRHFRPERVDGVADVSTVVTLDRLIAALPVQGLTSTGRNAYLRPVSWPDGRSGNGRKAAGEESPGSMETRCRVTPGGGDPRESATESKPPASGFDVRRVRVKGWGKSPPRARQRDRHGKPHREQDRIGMARGFGSRPVSGPVIRVGCARRPATGVPEEWPSRGGKPPYRTRLTGQLALNGAPPSDKGGGAARFTALFFGLVEGGGDGEERGLQDLQVLGGDAEDHFVHHVVIVMAKDIANATDLASMARAEALRSSSCGRRRLASEMIATARSVARLVFQSAR